MTKSAWAVVTVVVAVPAIILAVLVPKLLASYTYEKVLQVYWDVVPIQREVVEAAAARQALKAGPRQPPSSIARDIVGSIDVALNGQITVTFTKDPGGKLIFAPLALKGAETEWRCRSEGMPVNAVPKRCRE